MWYAEYTHSEVIHRFPNIYRKILDALEKYPEIKVSWDIECSITIPYLIEVAPDVIERIKKGVKEKRFEILVDTWSFTLATLHTPKELEIQIQKAIECLRTTFGKIAPGFYPQETAYAEPLPKFLRKFGLEFILVKKDTAEYFLTDQINSKRQGVYNLVGSDGTKIKAVFFDSTYQSLSDFVNFKIKDIEDESLILVLGDAEIFAKSELEKLFENMRQMNGLEPILVSEYVTTHEAIKDLKLPDCTWSLGGNDYGLWCRDPWDHYLWTLNEKARNMADFVERWFKKVPTTQKKLHTMYSSALTNVMLGQNSDKFGWNPCFEKRKEGETEFLSAIFTLDALAGILSEKVFSLEPEKYLRDKGVKRFLIDTKRTSFNHIVPISFDFKIEHKAITPNILLSTERDYLPFALSSEIIEDDYIVGGECTLLLETQKVDLPLMVYLEHKTPPKAVEQPFSTNKGYIDTPNLRAIHSTTSSKLQKIIDKESNVELVGDLFGYEIEQEEEFNSKIEEINESPAKPFPIYYHRDIKEADKNIEIFTSYRFYSRNGLIEIFREFSVKEPFVGVLYPLTFKLRMPVVNIWRNILDDVIPRKIKDEEIAPIMNNWLILEFENSYVLLASKGTVHAMKEALVSKDKVVLAPIETLYEENKLEHINGTIKFQILFKMAPKKKGMLDVLVELAEYYSKPPYIIDMCQHEGPRTI